jgi:hypothetical protein
VERGNEVLLVNGARATKNRGHGIVKAAVKIKTALNVSSSAWLRSFRVTELSGHLWRQSDSAKVVNALN